jgi:phosphatidylglycerophosphate synthase
MRKILGLEELENISKHKYSSNGASILDPLFQPFWCFVVEAIPLTIAPNMLTFVGLILNVTCGLMIIYFDPKVSLAFRGLISLKAYNSYLSVFQTSSWVYFTSAVGLFVYQTLDAIDGKQARRTKSSSPLGELFDHGCDAMSAVLMGIALILSVSTTTIHPWCAFMIFVPFLASFYAAHWHSSVIGFLRFGKCVI